MSDDLFSAEEIRRRLQEIKELSAKRAAFALEKTELDPLCRLLKKKEEIQIRLEQSSQALEQTPESSPLRVPLEQERIQFLLEMEQVRSRIPAGTDEKTFLTRYLEILARLRELDDHLQTLRHALVEDKKKKSSM